MKTYAAQLQALHETIVYKKSEAALPLIKPARHNMLSPHMRLAIYTDGYDVRLIDATLADYPALNSLMGEKRCRDAVSAFVSATASMYWDLNRYPVAFANFLKHYSSDRAAHALAELESAIAEVFWLPESAPLTPDMPAELSEEELGNQQFMLRTAAKLLKLDYAANKYLTAFRAGDNILEPEETTEHLLVIRLKNEVRRIVLEPMEYALLAAINNGKSFGEALSLNDAQETLTEKLPHYIARWLQCEIFQH